MRIFVDIYRFLFYSWGYDMAKLYFYYSAMNAGKSTTLLQSSYNYEERGMDTIIFAPAVDTRFGEATVYSRIGIRKEAIPFDSDTNILEITEQERERKDNLKCVLVDEAQFLSKAQVQMLVEIVSRLNIPALCYGLRSDFLGEPFEASKYLLAWAHELSEIKTICDCGSKATMNIRIDEEGHPVVHGSQVQIGGNDSYKSVCLNHFVEAIPLATPVEDV